MLHGPWRCSQQCPGGGIVDPSSSVPGKVLSGAASSAFLFCGALGTVRSWNGRRVIHGGRGSPPSGIGLLTTCSAPVSWCLVPPVARIRLPLPHAVADITACISPQPPRCRRILGTSSRRVVTAGTRRTSSGSSGVGPRTVRGRSCVVTAG